MALFYFGKSRFFLPKAIGSFLIVLAIVMFVVAAGQMFDSWDAMKRYPDCIASIGSETDSVAMLKYLECKDSLYRITGMQLRPDQARITQRQFTIALMSPIGELLLWSAVFLFGLFLYNTQIVRFVPKVRPEPVENPKKKRKKEISKGL